MSDLVAKTPPGWTTNGPRGAETPGAACLSVLDRFLPVWIIAAMALGLGLGRLIPGLDDALSAVEGRLSQLPIAIGLLLMMLTRCWPRYAATPWTGRIDARPAAPQSAPWSSNWLVGAAR